ncbi:MAG TPA: pantoate--beta-alanine ligase [Rhizomicrobium sp.]|jgi:pantoate--beta-alanine ligase|nr:pantoate--beta-alanine ligase [Rhizomicrobium sp.]
MQSPTIVTSVGELRALTENWRRNGQRISLVPTMGALHAGHLSLVALARNRVDRVVVSIFVNPSQFAPHEDFERYPRNIQEDYSRLASAGGADIVFAPPLGELYPDGFATRIEVAGPAGGLETEFRPHFFSGVATIVAKLLLAATPDIAVFGEKDYQQLLVVRRLARDLGLDTEISGAPIVRESDGLALSSRNAYLGTKERRIAGQLNRVLAQVAAEIRSGVSIAEGEKSGNAALFEAGFDTVDYVAIRDAATLSQLDGPVSSMRALAAATIGGTRLIDNMPV